MSKIQNSSPKIQYFEQTPIQVELNPEQQKQVQTIPVYEQRTDSLSETRALREGIDYGVQVRYDVDVSYKEKNGKGWGKGGKKEVKENLEAELMAIIEERIVESHKIEQEAIKEDIKRVEINDSQVRDEVKNSEENTEIRKKDIKVANYLNEIVQTNLKRS